MTFLVHQGGAGKTPPTADTIVVLTARSPERILREGGSQAWVLNPARAKQCTWLLCTQNRHHPDPEFSDATEPHGMGFLLGRIATVQKSNDHEGPGVRWLIALREYARIQLPKAWDQGRNPVRYRALADFRINLDKVTFQPMPLEEKPPPRRAGHPAPSILTLAEAKRQLADTFGVKPEAVEITIRG